MKKDFKIARRPGQGSANLPIDNNTEPESDPVRRAAASPRKAKPKKRQSGVGQLGFELGATTRKTIEVPEGYFYQVKMRALQRRMKEKELWAEILREYFSNHPGL